MGARADGSTAASDAATLPALLAARVRAAPDDVALVCDDARITHAELDAASRAVARHLMAGGVGKGTRVGVLLPNGIDWAVLALGVARAGAVLIPLSTLLRPAELLRHLAVADVDTLVVVPEYRRRRYVDELTEVLPGTAVLRAAQGRLPQLPALRRISVWGEDFRTEGTLPALPEPEVRPADDLVVLFTSGSRGTPKGTIHTHGGALHAVASGLEARCIRPGDRLYIPMPFFWAGGLAGGLLTALVAGATLLTETSPEPAATIEFLRRERVSVFRGWPDQGARIAAQPAFDPADLPDLRPGSLDAVLPAALRARPGARANLFGMSETFGPYAGSPLDTDLPPGKAGSCGRPFDGIDVQIREPDTGRPMAPGESGEILLRGPRVMRGICGRERHEVFDADGWYATGDLGRLDAEGFLWYDGRLDDMVKVSGATVYPVEVERGLRSLPGVTHAYATPVVRAGRTEIGALVVAPGFDAGEVSARARTVLSSFKVPTVWLVAADDAEVPRLASDKPDVRELQRRLADSGERPPAP